MPCASAFLMSYFCKACNLQAADYELINMHEQHAIGISMRSHLKIDMQFVHRTNIANYRKILRSHDLTAEECRFVERRLGEEQAFLKQILEGISHPHTPTVLSGRRLYGIVD